jgi:hypothetical protein
MSLSSKYRHDTIHRYNIATNYIRTENCRHCVSEKTRGYGEFANVMNFYDYDEQLLPNNFQQYWRNVVVDNIVTNGYNIDNINDFVLLKVDDKNIKKIKTNTEDNCPICLIAYDKEGIKLAKCQHVFHNDCLNEWLHYNDNCPLCRTII